MCAAMDKLACTGKGGFAYAEIALDVDSDRQRTNRVSKHGCIHLYIQVCMAASLQV